MSLYSFLHFRHYISLRFRHSLRVSRHLRSNNLFVFWKWLQQYPSVLILKKEVLVRRNCTFSAQTETYERSVRCSVTNLIFVQICSTSFITMQNELLNKASIFEFHPLAARRLNDTVKHKGFNDFFTLRYLKICQVRTSHL